MKARDSIENADKRGTKALKRRVRKVEERAAALRSAHEAGYRRGKDEQDRDLNTRHDAEINRLRNLIADVADAVEARTVEAMDREFVKGWLDAHAAANKLSPDADVAVVSARLCNAIARELSRAYEPQSANDKERSA